jgi:antitoxin FitA
LQPDRRRDIGDIKCEVAMVDLLIRDVGPQLKRKLEESARKNNHSLSEEAKAILEHGLATKTDNRKLGTLMSQLLAPEDRSDDYIFEIRGGVSRPPDFE